MNEKIRELILQAREETREGKWKPPTAVWTERFAELIIEESIIDFYRRYLDTTSGEDITVQVERYIKENFGVE